jgi:signal transduction histidine kinase
VVTNLLSNALKYVPAASGRVEVTGALEDGCVCLSVRDNGIGIPAAYHRGIFELFGRVPGQEQVVDGQVVAGTGVGLAIVKRIVEAHAGTVAVESEPGAGSRFTVRLPAGKDA